MLFYTQYFKWESFYGATTENLLVISWGSHKEKRKYLEFIFYSCIFFLSGCHEETNMITLLFSKHRKVTFLKCSPCHYVFFCKSS